MLLRSQSPPSNTKGGGALCFTVQLPRFNKCSLKKEKKGKTLRSFPQTLPPTLAASKPARSNEMQCPVPATHCVPGVLVSGRTLFALYARPSHVSSQFVRMLHVCSNGFIYLSANTCNPQAGEEEEGPKGPNKGFGYLQTENVLASQPLLQLWSVY